MPGTTRPRSDLSAQNALRIGLPAEGVDEPLDLWRRNNKGEHRGEAFLPKCGMDLPVKRRSYLVPADDQAGSTHAGFSSFGLLTSVLTGYAVISSIE
jgi:hypothetical protein